MEKNTVVRQDDVDAVTPELIDECSSMVDEFYSDGSEVNALKSVIDNMPDCDEKWAINHRRNSLIIAGVAIIIMFWISGRHGTTRPPKSEGPEGFSDYEKKLLNKIKDRVLNKYGRNAKSEDKPQSEDV